jgi:hypothetical protein
MKKAKTQSIVMNTVAELSQSTLQRIVINLKAKTRYETMEDEQYLVVPMVMLVEGVHNGSLGPLLYPKEELKQLPQVWNHKPVVVYHPQTGTACVPNILTSSKIGIIMNAKWDGNKLKAEAWLKEDRIKKVDTRILEKIQNGEPVEISTGLYTENEMVAGEWQGEKYVGIARNYKPDHLAVLPDLKGACSIADGAGLLRNASGELAEIPVLFKTPGNEDSLSLFAAFGLVHNELSFDSIRQQLDSLLAGLYTDKSVWTLEVFKSFFIFDRNRELFRQDYELDGDKVKLMGIPVTVQRVISYEPVLNTNERKIQMDKKKVVDALIANKFNSYDESHRELLMNMTDEALTVVAAADKGYTDALTNAQQETANAKKPKQDAAPAQTVQNTDAGQKPSLEEYISNAPKEIQEVLQNGVSAHQREKAELITAITANKSNTLSKELLETMPIDQLRGVATLAKNTQEPVKQPKQPTHNYNGNPAPADGATKVEPLVLPTMNFEPKKK